MFTRDVVFRDRYGLHPRSAHRIGEVLAGVATRVTLEDLDGSGSSIDARSMLALVSSGIRTGARVRVTAEGPDEETITARLGDLLESGVCHP